MAFVKHTSEVLPERRGVVVDKLQSQIDHSLRNTHRGRRFGRISGRRLLIWVFSLAVLFSIYLSVFGFNMLHGFFPCEVSFLDSVNYLIEPKDFANISQFSVQYVEKEERSLHDNAFELGFGGHQTLEEGEKSFFARNHTIHCGFVKGPEGFQSTGFDLEKEDKKYMSRCSVSVSSCIFGSSDFLRSPTSKLISEYSKRNVCFVMFVDEQTLSKLSAEGNVPDDRGCIGLWKIFMLETCHTRICGKLERYSIWLDSKLRLVADPMLIIEYFLWRAGSEYAISNHYTRHCVWEEDCERRALARLFHHRELSSPPVP
ncbi:hypothetical protein ACH5RR_009537 [Cinchona calisaya]|uniref:TOD1/MUCI70 glycosyltransferase-like domain-containing protein n=1 Tax=Cinchona calisaya TaxID=153742 RepID=A0ABD3AHJ0_9GENT